MGVAIDCVSGERHLNPICRGETPVGASQQPLLSRQHHRQRWFVGVVPAEQVQQAMAGEKEQLLLQRMAVLIGLPGGGFQGNNDVAELEDGAELERIIPPAPSPPGVGKGGAPSWAAKASTSVGPAQPRQLWLSAAMASSLLICRLRLYPP